MFRVVTEISHRSHSSQTDPTPSTRQWDSAERLMEEVSKPHIPDKGLTTRQLSASLNFTGQQQKAAWRYSREPQGQEIKSKALQASWRAAAASLPPNYHSAQLPAASGSVPARGSRRCRDVGRQLLGRGTHPAAEPQVCYRLPFRKEKEVGGKKPQFYIEYS